jgi:hypothetical protein
MILSPFGRLASFFELFIVLRCLSALRAFGEKFGEHHRFDRREINAVNGSENIEIYLVRLSDEG